MAHKISILMPSYNYEKYIGKAIESVLQQTYQNWELIIIDDGSKDDSAKIIESYRDKRITFLKQENIGVTKTLNKALKLSKGDYICFLDADDFYNPKKLESQVKMMKKGFDIVTTKVIAVNAEGKDSYDKFFNLWWNSYDPEIIFGENKEFKFFGGNYLCKSALMIRKSLFAKYGDFNTQLITAYDLELWFKMIPEAKIGRCDEILTYYRWHGLNETTTNTLRMRVESLLIYDKYMDNLNLSMKEDAQRVINFINGFTFTMREQELYNGYLALQIIKKSSNIDDVYTLIDDERLIKVLKRMVRGKYFHNKIVTDGQANIGLLMKQSVFQKIRRKLLPYRLRAFIKNFLSARET